MSMLRKAALVAAFTLVPSAPALAAEPVKAATRIVRTADLDLSSAKDRDRLMRRVSSAAYFVCMHDAQGRFSNPTADSRRLCHARVMDDVQPRLAAVLANGASAKLAARRGIEVASR